MSSALLVGIAAALVVFVTFVAWGARLRAALDDAEAHRATLEKDLIALRRQLTQAERQASSSEAEKHFLTQFLREFPHLIQELHSGVSERRVPMVLLSIVTRVFEPRQALVLLRRRHAESDPSRSLRLNVAAVSPAESPVKRGTELLIGKGELGFVAETQRAMDRHDFDTQTGPTRAQFKQDRLPDFEPDLAAPMVFGEETLGVLALERPGITSAEAKDVLRLVAQVGALALHDVLAYAEMKVTADVDGLTRVYNKRHLTQALAEEILKAQQQLSSLSVFLLDLDNFKHYNDTNGHLAGDDLLRAMARLVWENTRKDNIFGRFGGEEFLLILPGATAAQALRVAEKIRGLIAGHAFPFAATQPLGAVTISGGVAEYPSNGLDSNSLVQSADEALYQAKHKGRNRVLAAALRYLDEDETPPGAGQSGG